MASHVDVALLFQPNLRQQEGIRVIPEDGVEFYELLGHNGIRPPAFAISVSRFWSPLDEHRHDDVDVVVVGADGAEDALQIAQSERTTAMGFSASRKRADHHAP